MKIKDLILEEERLSEFYDKLYVETDNCIFRDILREKETHIKYLKELDSEE